ncbi:MAG: hypothetical protein AMS20_00205 [Gemmatimonas sp. SG8_28]|nr:MAG: hypothetical protein AMS20_00205 [Gemmatimonas sp. SG8_28]
MNAELDAAVLEFQDAPEAGTDVRNPYCRHNDIHAFCPYSPEQEAFSKSNAFETFFGGAAGPGKTVILLNEGLRQVDNIGYRAIFFRRTYDELDQVIEMSHETFPLVGGRFNKSQHLWRFPYRAKSASANIIRASEMGASYKLAYCERDVHKYRYQGRAYAYIAWDEITQYPNPSVYLYLFLRCRPLWQGHQVRCYIRAASNPGGPGHSWVKERFIDNREPGRYYLEIVEDEVTGKQRSYLRQFIPATLDSNDILMQTTQYETALLAYPDPELRRAMRHGHWDIAAGVMFSELREAIHRVPASPPLDWTNKEIVIDWGYNDYCHVLWIEATSGVGEPMRARVYRELVVREKTGAMVGQMIAERTHTDERITRIVCDTQAWSSIGGEPSPAEEMMPRLKVRGWTLTKAIKGPGSRVRGWQTLHTWFYPFRKGGPLLTISDNCRVLWRQMTSLARGIEPHDVEELEPHQEDHGADALRYWAQMRPRPAMPTGAEMLEHDPDLDKLLDQRSYQEAKDRRVREITRQSGFPAVKVQTVYKPKPPRVRSPWALSG